MLTNILILTAKNGKVMGFVDLKLNGCQTSVGRHVDFVVKVCVSLTV